MYRANRVTRMIVLFLLIAPIAIFLFGTLVMFLWNKALVPVLHVSEVTFWQALGILVLSKILFGSFSGGSRRSSWRQRWKERMTQKWNNMTPEEKERFRAKYQDRWGSGCRPWDEKAGQSPS